MDASQLPDQPEAKRKEIYGLWVTSFGAGPLMSVIAIILQLLIVKQTKYLASTNEEWVEWRDKFDDDIKCENGTSRDDPEPYKRPKGMSSDCDWFPKNKAVPGLGLDYTSIVLLGSAAILLITGVLLVVCGPFGDFGHYRRRLLIISFMVCIPSFGAMGFVSDPHLYWLNSILGVTGAVSFFFALKAPFVSYLPLLIESHWKLFELKKQYLKCPSSRAMLGEALNEGDLHGIKTTKVSGVEGQTPEASLEMVQLGAMGVNTSAPPVILVQQNSRDTLGRRSTTRSSNEGLEKWKCFELEKSSSTKRMLASGIAKSDDAEVQALSSEDRSRFKEAYHSLHQAIAGDVTLKESASFLTGQVLGLLVQFAIVFSIGNDDNPRDTRGERGAVLVATIWMSVFSTIGVSLLKAREGPPFPQGNRFFIGFSRSVKTLRLMSQKLSMLLCLMLGRMFLWLGAQSIITVFTVFLEREFLLSTEAFGPLLLIYFVCGAISALGASIVVSKFPSYTLTMFKVYSILVSLLPGYILVGVRVKAELYILMVVASFLTAPFPSLVRAMMAHMIPEGFTATIMSFEGLLENATVWIGPVIVFMVLEVSDSMRLAVFSLVVFMIAGLPFTFYVKMGVARDQRSAFEKWNRAGRTLG